MSSCKCKLKSCIECNNAKIQKLEEKVNRYKKAFAIIEDDIRGEHKNNSSFGTSNNSLYESVIYQKDSDGYMQKKQLSDLGESYYIVSTTKNIKHLSNKEISSINAQNDLAKSSKAKSWIKKGTYLYGAVNIATKVVGILLIPFM